jgi:uncharacterized protein YndB with AHSA1/START domain
MTARKLTIDGRPALVLERRLAYPMERVWRAVSDPAELARWFPATVQWIPEEGETFEAYGQSGEITEVDPPRRLAWKWGSERYSFELAEHGDDCLLTFTHVFPDPTLQDQHARGWDIYFTRLDVHLTGGFLSEEEAHAQAGGGG